MNTQKIIERIDKDQFKELVSKYKTKIFVGGHALEHLSMGQRKLYEEDNLKNPLLKEKPVEIGLQKNGRYAVYYTRNKGFLKLILSIMDNRLEIVTFINVETIPNLEKMKNGE